MRNAQWVPDNPRPRFNRNVPNFIQNLHPFVPVTNNAGANRFNPIVIEDSDSDDDIIEIGRGFTRNDPAHLGPVEKRIIPLKRFKVSIPKFDEKFANAFFEAQKIDPQICLEKVSSFLDTAIRTDTEIINLVDRIILAGEDPKTPKNPTFAENFSTFLRNWFPSIYLKDIRSKLIANNYNLKSTIKDLESMRTTSRIKNPKKTSEIISISDVLLSIQVLGLYREEEEERAAESHRVRYETEKSLGHLEQCECCCDDFLPEDMAHCPVGHKFCVHCLNTNVENVISSGRFEIKCLSMEDCNELVSTPELIRCVEPKLLRQLFTLESQDAVRNSDIKNTVTCHFCGLIVEYEGQCDFSCPECHKLTCFKCGKASHEGRTCEEMKEVDENRIVEEQMNEAVVRVCPKCGAQFMKDEGCNRMECPKCHTWICYWCRKEISKEEGYAHFWTRGGVCPPDRCPLWVENGTLHKIEAIQAKQNGNI
ncbi:IBR domain containing protein [Histomonas meleagridis]|uniref:IBR domain containing protein n=1 Tax=Histomonas meleagridis TaxID=135588 RepID=UPI00355A51C8|nr:IBR domain containing protein [Histomonas meleagridis]KAH0796892.1 IBR domain containing protein [Histomonas meleagridis]